MIATKRFLTIISVLALAFFALPTLTHAQVWTPPEGPPTEFNAPNPIHQGATTQHKSPGINSEIGATRLNALFSVVGELLIGDGRVSSKEFCLGDGDSIFNYPGYEGLDCVNAETGWGGQLPDGDRLGQSLYWLGDSDDGEWLNSNLVKQFDIGATNFENSWVRVGDTVYEFFGTHHFGSDPEWEGPEGTVGGGVPVIIEGDIQIVPSDQVGTTYSETQILIRQQEDGLVSWRPASDFGGSDGGDGSNLPDGINDGDILIWNGTEWIPSTLPPLGDGGDLPFGDTYDTLGYSGSWLPRNNLQTFQAVYPEATSFDWVNIGNNSLHQTTLDGGLKITDPNTVLGYEDEETFVLPGFILTADDSEGNVRWHNPGDWYSEYSSTYGFGVPDGETEGQYLYWTGSQWLPTNAWAYGDLLDDGDPILALNEEIWFAGTGEGTFGEKCNPYEVVFIDPLGDGLFDELLKQVTCTSNIKNYDAYETTVDFEDVVLDIVDIAPSDFTIIDTDNLYIQTDGDSNSDDFDFDTVQFPGFWPRQVLSTKTNGFATWRTPITIFGDSENAGVRADNTFFIGDITIFDEETIDQIEPRHLCYVPTPFGNQVVDCEASEEPGFAEYIHNENLSEQCHNLPFGYDEVTVIASAGGGGGGGGAAGYPGGGTNPESSNTGVAGGGGGGGQAGDWTGADGIIFDDILPIGNNPGKICMNIGNGGEGGYKGQYRVAYNTNLFGNGSSDEEILWTVAEDGGDGGDTVLWYVDASGVEYPPFLELDGGNGGNGGEQNTGNTAGDGALGGIPGAGAETDTIWWHNGRLGSTLDDGALGDDINTVVLNYVGFPVSWASIGYGIGGNGGVGENPANFDLYDGSIFGSGPEGPCSEQADGGWEGNWDGSPGCSQSVDVSPGAGGGGGGGGRGYWHYGGYVPFGMDEAAYAHGSSGGSGASGKVEIIWQ